MLQQAACYFRSEHFSVVGHVYPCALEGVSSTRVRKGGLPVQWLSLYFLASLARLCLLWTPRNANLIIQSQ